MALTNAYLITTRNLEAFLNAIRSARAPERFTNRFLTQLDFASSNDRLLIGVLKGLGLLDENGAPTQRYYDFLDQTESGRILADAIREAYADLFAINRNAQDMTVEEVKNKLRTLTQGQKSENVLNLMATTFKALTTLADWDAPNQKYNRQTTHQSLQQILNQRRNPTTTRNQTRPNFNFTTTSKFTFPNRVTQPYLMQSFKR
jgi:Family of unknown function (DUF5343)